MIEKTIMMKLLKVFSVLFTINIYISYAYGQEAKLNIDGFEINYKDAGLELKKPGQPVVVFESGLGTDLGNWSKVFDSIAQFAPVFSYDRPGIGKSEPDHEQPTTQNVVNKLCRILASLDLSPPYLLVGHSLGGAYVRGFASMYPDKVCGLVIIDPADFTETREIRRSFYQELEFLEQEIDTIIFNLLQSKLDSNMPPSIQEEHWALRAMRNNDFQFEISQNIPDVPVFIMTSAKYENYPGGEELFRAKMKKRVERWSEVLNSISVGRLTYSSNAGHFIQIDDPELVISCIKIAYTETLKNSRR